MSTYTFLVNEMLRVAVNAPEKSQVNCEPDDVIPIVVIGDSSKCAPWSTIEQILNSNQIHGDFIVDMLLVNGPCNRYMHVSPEPSGRWNFTSMADKGGVSATIHDRATIYLQYLSDHICAMNVLTPAQMYAVKNGIPISQRTVNG